MTAALTLQLALLVYHQITTLFDLYPFNGARFSPLRERGLEAAVNFALMGLGPIGFGFGIPFLIRAATAYYPILFACELATWFFPYFFGASAKWEEIYGRVQGQTIMVLPRRGANPTPNLEHLILMALTVATAIVTLATYRSMPGASFRQWPIAVAIGAFMIYGIARTQWRLGKAATAASRVSEGESK